jgi:hypothetical protein
MWYLTFDWVGTLKKNDGFVYFVHDPEIKQELLLAPKRRDLWKKFGAGDAKSNKPGCIGRKLK